MEDIEVLSRKKLVTQEMSEVYSTLRCRKCTTVQEFAGTITFRNVPPAWASLSLATQGNGAVSEWLLCPECAREVRLAAGLVLLR